MSKIFEDNSQTIGHTPLVRLNRVTKGRVLAKIESRNPSFSVKCRIGANLIWDAEKRGVLTKGKEIIEPTSGNTGIALAFVAAARGYPITLTMPATMSLERRKLLKALGANLVLTEGPLGMKGPLPRPTRSSNPSRANMCCCSSLKTRPTRKSTRRPLAPRSGMPPMVRWMCLWQASAPAAPSRVSPAT